jgi:hypothetical protein
VNDRSFSAIVATMTMSEFDTLRADFAAMRTDMAGLRTDIDGRLIGLRTDMDIRFARLEAKLDETPGAATIYHASLAMIAGRFVVMIGTVILLKTINVIS